MSFLFPRKNLKKTRAQKNKTDLTKLLIGTVLSFFICLAFVIYCVRIHETKLAVILAILSTISLANSIFYYHRIIKKLYRRYALLCTDDEFKTVLIVSSLRKINSFNVNRISMFFFRKEEQARDYAKLNDTLLQKNIPKVLKKQTKGEMSRLLKENRTSPFFYSPVDLYDLRKKKILLSENVHRYYGEPDRFILFQNECTLLFLNDEEKNLLSATNQK